VRDARFADAGLAGQHHRLPLAVARQGPALEQQRDLAVAADQVDQLVLVLGLEAARDAARADHEPGLDRRREPLQRERAERRDLERRADQMPGLVRHHDLARAGVTLQPCREIRRFSARGLFGRRGAAADLADDDEAGRDADPGLQLDVIERAQAGHRVDGGERGVDRALGVVLMGARVAEVDEHAVAEQLGDMAVERADGRRRSPRGNGGRRSAGLPDRDGRELRRADHVAEHHRQLAALGFDGMRGPARTLRPPPAVSAFNGAGGAAAGAARASAGERLQSALAVTERGDAELLQVGIVELGQHVEGDVLFVRRLRHSARSRRRTATRRPCSSFGRRIERLHADLTGWMRVRRQPRSAIVRRNLLAPFAPCGRTGNPCATSTSGPCGDALQRWPMSADLFRRILVICTRRSATCC
jgi:hypothetical protein